MGTRTRRIRRHDGRRGARGAAASRGPNTDASRGPNTASLSPTTRASFSGAAQVASSRRELQALMRPALEPDRHVRTAYPSSPRRTGAERQRAVPRPPQRQSPPETTVGTCAMSLFSISGGVRKASRVQAQGHAAAWRKASRVQAQGHAAAWRKASRVQAQGHAAAWRKASRVQERIHAA
ncbi:hypothetical protein THAOC_26413, partial [Thalassiosira oceanica]